MATSGAPNPAAFQHRFALEYRMCRPLRDSEHFFRVARIGVEHGMAAAAAASKQGDGARFPARIGMYGVGVLHFPSGSHDVSTG